MKFLYPTTYLESVNHIDFNDLQKRGKTKLLFDLDNTIAPFDIKEPDEKILSFFKKLEQMGFDVCLVSNNSVTRVETFNKTLQLKILPRAGKPKLKGIKKAMAMINATNENSVMIGDQVFTDIWVGNRLNMETILVSPIANRDEFTVKLKRGIEKLVLKNYEKSTQRKK